MFAFSFFCIAVASLVALIESRTQYKFHAFVTGASGLMLLSGVAVLIFAITSVLWKYLP